MVMVSFSREFIFLKTRKTAGTSIEMALEPLCRPAGAVVTERTRIRITAEGIVGRRKKQPNIIDKMKFWQTDWHNHMTADQVRAALGEDKWQHFRKVTAIRNPFDTVVSRYHWKIEKDPPKDPDNFAEIYEKFNAWVHSDPFDCDKEIVHSRGQFIADHVIRFESLRPSFEEVYAQLVPGAAAPEIPRTKSNSRRRARPVIDYYDKDSIAAILKSAAWVFERFGYPETPSPTFRPQATDAKEPVQPTGSK